MRHTSPRPRSRRRLALFGLDIVTSNGSRTNTSSTPSAVVLSLFAFLTSWVVARYAFRQQK